MGGGEEWIEKGMETKEEARDNSYLCRCAQRLTGYNLAHGVKYLSDSQSCGQHRHCMCIFVFGPYKFW